MKVFYKIKYFFNRIGIKRKVGILGKNSYIKKKFYITGKKYISIGDNVSIAEGASIQCFDNYAGLPLEPNLTINNDVFINRFVNIFCADSIVIGSKTFIGSFVTITSENHGMDLNTDICFGEQPLIAKQVRIGSNCWIGDKAIVLPGVTIGNNVIIGANSVVTHDIPEGSIAVGNPARIIKKWNSLSERWEIFDNVNQK